MKVDNYIVITDSDEDSLAQKVLNAQDDGWEIHGNVSIASISDFPFPKILFAQAMVIGELSAVAYRAAFLFLWRYHEIC